MAKGLVLGPAQELVPALGQESGLEQVLV